MALPNTPGFGAALVSVGTAATPLAGVDSRRRMLVVQNVGTATTVYLGGSDVDTSTNGYPLAPGAVLALSSDVGVDVEDLVLYGRVASGTQNVAVLAGRV
jgi:hypothetical protein